MARGRARFDHTVSAIGQTKPNATLGGGQFSQFRGAHELDRPSLVELLPSGKRYLLNDDYRDRLVVRSILEGDGAVAWQYGERRRSPERVRDLLNTLSTALT